MPSSEDYDAVSKVYVGQGSYHIRSSIKCQWLNHGVLWIPGGDLHF